VVITAEPWASQIEAAGGHRLFDSTRMPGRIVDVMVAHAQAVRTLLHGEPVREAPLPAMLLAIAAAALVCLAAAPLAPAVGALTAMAALAGSLVALRLGWYTPLAAPLATLLAAILASRLLGRRPPPG